MDLWVFDIETNAFDPKLVDITKSIHTIHCLVVKHMDTGVCFRFNDKFPVSVQSVEEGLRMLENLQCIGGHNIQRFDIPAIQNVYPWFKPAGIVLDSLPIAEAQFGVRSELFGRDKRRDAKLAQQGKQWIEKKLWGSHSLAAWGQRNGRPKDDYAERCKELGVDPWAQWSKEMEDYCEQDVDSTIALFAKLGQSGILDKPAARIESAVAGILFRQETHGVCFDVPRARELHAVLVGEKERLNRSLHTQMGEPFYLRDGRRQTVKRTIKRWVQHPAGARTRTIKGDVQKGWYEHREADCEWSKVKLTEFSPNSRDHIALKLQRTYGWEPESFGKDGKPTVDEDTLSGLPYPPVPTLLEALTVSKWLGALATGKGAWLALERDGRIHGRVSQCGARTGRMTHSKPNITQVWKQTVAYCDIQARELFGPPPGYKQVGCDAEGIELRAQGHYLGKYDGGAFSKSVVEGDKAEGTDAHSRTRDLLGLHSRDITKTWTYANFYGAGAVKKGLIVYSDFTPEQRQDFGTPTETKLAKLGQLSTQRYNSSTVGMDRLRRKLDACATSKRKSLPGIDGRMVRGVSKHNALNTLYQSFGGLVMKLALVLLDEDLQAAGWKNSRQAENYDYEFMINAHDEFQLAVLDVDDKPTECGRRAADAIKRAGEQLNLRCPLAGDFAVGANWHQTH